MGDVRSVMFQGLFHAVFWVERRQRWRLRCTHADLWYSHTSLTNNPVTCVWCLADQPAKGAT